MVNGAGLRWRRWTSSSCIGGEPANFLDVGGGATKERVTTAFKIISSDPNVEGHSGEYLRRHHALRRDRRRASVARRAKSACSVPLVVRLEGTNVELGKKIMADSGLHIIARRSGRCRAENCQAVKEAAIMAVLVDKNTKVICQGFHRQPGHFPFRTGDCLRHQDGRWRDAWQGRSKHLGPAGLRYRCGAAAETGANALGDLRAAAFRRRRILEAIEAEIPLVICITEGIPVLDMVTVKRGCTVRHAADRPELPRRHHAGRMQDRHHARPYSQARQGRHRLAVRHPDL